MATKPPADPRRHAAPHVAPDTEDDAAAVATAESEQVLPSEPEVPEAEQLLLEQIADLKRKLVDAEAQTRHYAQAYDKARSEFAAARDRMQREQERLLKQAKAKAVTGLIGVLDSLDRSLDSVRTQPAGPAFVTGVQAIRAQFDAALVGLDLLRFDGVGEAFDPTRHQAVTTVPVDDPAQDGKVLQAMASGAMVGDELVRPAMVIVGRYVAIEAPGVN